MSNCCGPPYGTIDIGWSDFPGASTSVGSITSSTQEYLNQVLTAGQQSQSIPFTVNKSSLSLSLVGGLIYNTTDTNPFVFAFEVTSYALSGITILLNGLPDTGNYYFQGFIYVKP